MNFEDIINMELIANDDSDYSYCLEQPIIVEQEDIISSTIPSLDQLKYLIEAAKIQVTIKEQEIQTASPSVIFAPPPSSSSITKNIPNNSEELHIKSDDSVHSEESITTLEAYAAADGIDLKKISSKERRQLRNKLSARNFRMRRKEYINSLEEQVVYHKKTTEELKQKLNVAEEENDLLYKEMDLLKKQLNQSIQPLSKPNINKNIGILGKNNSHNQQQESILVSSAVMPSWDYQSILQEQSVFRQLAAHFLLFITLYYPNISSKYNDLYVFSYSG